jgi:hypothetical protein
MSNEWQIESGWEAIISGALLYALEIKLALFHQSLGEK